MGKAIVYCGTCGKSLREDDAERSRAAAEALRCAVCRPEPAPAAIFEGRSGTKSRTFPAFRSIRSKTIENPLMGILLNAALVAVGALLLVTVTPGETTTADHRTRLDAALTNIQKIRDSDPGFTRAAEILSLYEAAAGIAGQKRPDVDRLREEYVREARKNARD